MSSRCICGQFRLDTSIGHNRMVTVTACEGRSEMLQGTRVLQMVTYNGPVHINVFLKQVELKLVAETNWRIVNSHKASRSRSCSDRITQNCYKPFRFCRDEFELFDTVLQATSICWAFGSNRRWKENNTQQTDRRSMHSRTDTCTISTTMITLLLS